MYSVDNKQNMETCVQGRGEKQERKKWKVEFSKNGNVGLNMKTY